MSAGSTIEDYGQDRYTYVAGDRQRYQTGRTRTILPSDHETNEAFQERMHLMALQLTEMAGIASVSVTFDRSEGAITRCTVTIMEAPRPAPIEPDKRPAGGRFSPRGGRGGRPDKMEIGRASGRE